MFDLLLKRIRHRVDQNSVSVRFKEGISVFFRNYGCGLCRSICCLEWQKPDPAANVDVLNIIFIRVCISGNMFVSYLIIFAPTC